MEQALVSQERTPYQIMDALDDELIKAELENRIVDTWVYSFKGSDGRPQTGLSKVGVDACCTEMAKSGHVIREGLITMQKDPTNGEYVLFSGPATRYVVNQDGQEVKMETVNGTKRQWIKMKLKSGKIVDDPFWYEKGAMKALRNARARLIPEEIRTKIITLAKQKGKVKDVKTEDGPSEQTNEIPKGNGDGMTEPQRKKLWAMCMNNELSRDDAKTFIEWALGDKPTKKSASVLIESFDTVLQDFQAS